MAAKLDTLFEDWPVLDAGVLLKPRSRKVCLTSHGFRHHAGVNGLPVLAGQLHQRLMAHGESFPSPCQGWSDAMPARGAGQRRWPGLAPHVGR